MEDSGGGVTLCGGEPLMHGDYTLTLLRELGRRGLHRTVDTTLYASAETVRAVAAECELLLVDLKLMDSDKHRRYTGVGNELILQNIRLLCQPLSTLYVFFLPHQNPLMLLQDFSAGSVPLPNRRLHMYKPYFLHFLYPHQYLLYFHCMSLIQKS